jgi:pycsar effector protein
MVREMWRRILCGNPERRDEARRRELEARRSELEQSELLDRAARFAALLLAEAREEIGRADEKGSILLAGTGVSVSAVIAGIFASNWSPSGLRPTWQLVWWIGVVAVLAGVLLLLAAVYPRTRASQGDERRHLFYFEHVAQFDQAAELEAALVEAASSGSARAAHQLLHISRIVRLKYHLIRSASHALVVGAACCLTAVIQPFS